ncbi:MAG: B12-binding domain-containing radical SAM protein, partial [Planctomycetota bacterium]
THIRERGIRDVEIADDTFTGRRSRALAIFDLILAEKLDVSFRIKSRVDVFTEELAKKARRAGVYLVAFGMESGSQRMLDAMVKKTTVEMNARACALTRKYGMLSHSSWIIGYPGETPETVSETLDFIRKHRPSTVNFGVLRPYPNTEAYQIAADAGTLAGRWHPDADELPWVRLPWAPEKKILDDLCRKAMRKVYFTPYYAAAFAGQILRHANWKLAHYAWQEFLRVLRLKRPGGTSTGH